MRRFWVRVRNQKGRYTFPCLPATAKQMLIRRECTVVSVSPLTIQQTAAQNKCRRRICPTKKKWNRLCNAIFWISSVFLYRFLFIGYQDAIKSGLPAYLHHLAKYLIIMFFAAVGYLWTKEETE